jgi:hypothetical protein
VVSIVVAPFASAETHLVWDLLQQETTKGCIYIGDRIFGIYSVMQALQAASQEAIVRLTESRARALVKRANASSLQAGASCPIEWKPTRHDKTFANWPTPTISGRLIYLRLTKSGFRPLDIYLFTTFLDAERYPLTDIAALYQQRWQIEVNFRHVKTTMHMEVFNVQSAALFRKELEAGLLAYNLVRGLMSRASVSIKLKPLELSFSQCLRRVRRFLFSGVPRWLAHDNPQTWLIMRLSKCRLPRQPNKVPYEPRAIRKPPFVYPYLRGDRALARQKVLEQFAIS